MNQPLWATPERQWVLDVLTRFMLDGRCSNGHTDCPVLAKVRQVLVHFLGEPGEANPISPEDWRDRAALIVQQLMLQPKYKPTSKLPTLFFPGQEPVRGISDTVTGGGIGFERRPVKQLTKGFLTRDELHHLPQWLSKELIEYWKVDDRDARSYMAKLEQRLLHHLPGIYNRGECDSIAKSEYVAKRPIWTIVQMGVSAFTMARAAKVYIPGLRTHIWVDLSGVGKPSRSKKRGYYRYGIGKAPLSMAEQIDDRCSQAVKRYLETPDI